MEYDNDRPLRPTRQNEGYYWLVFTLLYPIINGITILPNDVLSWPLLLGVHLVLLPAYIYFARIMGAVFLPSRRWDRILLLTLLAFLIIQAFLVSIYSMLSGLNLSPPVKKYFGYSDGTILRESCWTLLNLGLSIIIFQLQKLASVVLQLENLKKENSFYKLRYLRSQLNPHFLFNALNSIYSLSLQKSEQAPEAVVKLADIMRYLIYDCDKDKISLDKEIEFIKSYIEIEKIRYAADIRFTVEGDTAGILIEPFLFISFIENGFKYATENSFTEPFIYINLKVGNSQVSLNVINSMNLDIQTEAAQQINGKGIANSKGLLDFLYPDAYELAIIRTEKDEKRYSVLRLRNARERLETLYPDAFLLDVILSKSSFTVSLILKLNAA